MQSNQPVTAKDNHRQLLILCAALMTGVVMFSLAVIAINEMNGKIIQQKLPADVFQVISFSLAIICFVAARTLYRKKLAPVPGGNYQDVNAKLNAYRPILILYYALCEGPALFAIILYFLTGNFIFMAVTGFMLAAMFSKLPLKSRLVNELQLSSSEQQELE